MPRQRLTFKENFLNVKLKEKGVIGSFGPLLLARILKSSQCHKMRSHNLM